MFTYEQLQEETVAKLRGFAAKAGVGSGVWRAGASKEDLIAGILRAQDNVPIPTEAKQLTAPSGMSELGKMLAREVQPFLSTALDEEKLKAFILANIPTPKTIEIKRYDNTTENIGIVHFKFDEILKCVSVRDHVYLVGPAGSGKTTCAEKVAEALKLPFGCMSVGAQTSMAHIFGYMNAHGVYVATEFRKRYEQGGVFIFDEIDSGNANVLTSINSALANGQCAFPDSMVKRHVDFVCMAAGNTYGTGANRQYVGRNQLDAATLDRFTVIEFPYDEKLELAITGNDDWCKHVQRIRKSVEKLGLRVIVSPRASIKGAKLLSTGLDFKVVEELVIFKGLDAQTKEKILGGVS